MFVFGKDFPPKDREYQNEIFCEMEAWRSGDPNQLAYYYPRYGYIDMRSSRTFWRAYTYASIEMGARFNIASMVSSYMGDLLFGTEPGVRLADPGDTELLRTKLDYWGVWGKMREAAAMASLYGGVYVCPEWDEMAGLMALVAVPPTNVIPHFWHDQLVGATVFNELPGLKDGDKQVYRHFQQHVMDPEIGPCIIHSLWVGDKDSLGVNAELTAHPMTMAIEGPVAELMTDGTVANMAGDAPVGTMVVVPGDRLMLEYVPNKKPSVLGAEGESDLLPVRSAMFRLDQAASSWARDIRLGKTRIAYSNRAGQRTDGVDRFEEEQEIWYLLEGLGPSRDNLMPIQQIKMDIRSEEHRMAIMSLLEEIAGTIGLSPQQMGIRIEQPAETGAALKRRKERTLETQNMKRRYWEGPLCRTVENLLVVADAIGYRVVAPEKPTVVWGPAVEPSFEERADSVMRLSQAGALSTEEKVRMVHPDWTDMQVMDEVEKIKGDVVVAETVSHTNMDSDMGDTYEE